jgi:hypothetical protein
MSEVADLQCPHCGTIIPPTETVKGLICCTCSRIGCRTCVPGGCNRVDGIYYSVKLCPECIAGDGKKLLLQKLREG